MDNRPANRDRRGWSAAQNNFAEEPGNLVEDCKCSAERILNKSAIAAGMVDLEAVRSIVPADLAASVRRLAVQRNPSAGNRHQALIPVEQPELPA